MRLGRRRPFDDLIRRQLDLFVADNGELLRRIDAAERAYVKAAREESEELYGDYVDLVEEGAEALAGARDYYAWNELDEAASEEYIAAFNASVAKRLPRFALEIENL